jgi:hypothetical protein
MPGHIAYCLGFKLNAWFHLLPTTYIFIINNVCLCGIKKNIDKYQSSKFDLKSVQ